MPMIKMSHAMMLGTLVETASYVHNISSGSDSTRDQWGALVPVRLARAPRAIGPRSLRVISPGSWHEPGLKLPRQTRGVRRSFSSGSCQEPGLMPLLPIYTPPQPAFSSVFFSGVRCERWVLVCCHLLCN